MCVNSNACIPMQAPESCHTDIIRAIVCTSAGIIWTVSYDGAIFMYEVDRPKAVRRIHTKGSPAMCSAAFDINNGWLLTGAVDSSLAMWSQEGRCLEVMRDLGGNVGPPRLIPCSLQYELSCAQHGSACQEGRCLEVMRDLGGNVGPSLTNSPPAACHQSCCIDPNARLFSLHSL